MVSLDGLIVQVCFPRNELWVKKACFGKREMKDVKIGGKEQKVGKKMLQEYGISIK